MKSINLKIREKDKILILGPSGCGKSSLLYSIAGLIPELIYAKTSGKIHRLKENVAIVLQNPEAQMIAPTVEEELAFSMENRKIKPEIIKKRINDAVNRFNLKSIIHKSPSTLSGGQMQRVALISSLIDSPDVLLLDEPVSYLDQQGTADLLKILQELGDDISILIVEHKIDTFFEIINEIVLLNKNGQIEIRCDKHDFLELLKSKNNDAIKHLWINDNFKSLLAISRKNLPDVSPDVSSEIHQTAVKIENLTFSYTNPNPFKDNIKENVFSNLNLDIEKAKTTIIAGPIGSGKTTLLDNIAGFYCESKSYIIINNKSGSSLHKKQLYSVLNYSPQNPEHAFLKNTVREEILYSYDKNSSDQITFNIFNLNHLLEKNPFSLSEGEKRRLSIEILLSEKRDIILMDEPDYGLDFNSFHALIEGIRYMKKSGYTIIIASHNPELIFLVADKIVFLENGRILFKGTPNEYIDFINQFNPSIRMYYLPIWEKGTMHCC